MKIICSTICIIIDQNVPIDSQKISFCPWFKNFLHFFGKLPIQQKNYILKILTEFVKNALCKMSKFNRTAKPENISRIWKIDVKFLK